MLLIKIIHFSVSIDYFNFVMKSDSQSSGNRAESISKKKNEPRYSSNNKKSACLGAIAWALNIHSG